MLAAFFALYCCYNWHCIKELGERIYAELTLPEAKENPAYMGELVIESVGIDVPCVMVDPADSELNQRVVHKSNCAAMMWSSKKVITDEITGTWFIGDHADQGFKSITRCVIGDTAFFKNKDGSIQEYVVTASSEGCNENSILTYKGESILEDNLGGIILYTCLDSTGIPVYIVYLQPESSQ